MPDRRAELGNQQVIAQQCEWHQHLLVRLLKCNVCVDWIWLTTIWLSLRNLHATIVKCKEIMSDNTRLSRCTVDCVRLLCLCSLVVCILYRIDWWINSKFVSHIISINRFFCTLDGWFVVFWQVCCANDLSVICTGVARGSVVRAVWLDSVVCICLSEIAPGYPVFTVNLHPCGICFGL